MTEQVLDLFNRSAQAQDDSSKFQIAMLALAGVLAASVFLLVHTGF